MAGFFNLPSAKSTLKKDMKLAKKAAASKASNTITIKGGGSLIDRIQSITSLVQTKFKDKKDKFIVIRTEEEFIKYIDKCIENGVISIDTETTGLDPIEDVVVGLCIYTPDMKPAYVPVNHISYITQQRVDDQLPIEFLREQLERLNTHNVKTIWFNAPFDIRFIYHTIGAMLKIYWDASIASRILNSDEPKGGRGLKALHKKYCRNNEGEAFSFDKLFEGIPFNLIPVNTAYLYAANDAVITYELYQKQAVYLEYESPECIKDLAFVFHKIEMASMPAFIEMEENGCVINLEHAKSISEKYHLMAERTKKRAEEVLATYSDEIDAYRRATPGCKLSEPVNLDSPTQLAIILYDILKITSPNKKNPRSTDAETLEAIDNPLVDAILDNRFFNKMLSTYVDKIPQIIHKDGRVHCRFNQYGADCIVYDSLLLTDNGYMRIGDLFDGTETDGQFYDCNINIYNRNLQSEQSAAKIVFHNTDTYKLTLRGGYSVEGTPNHPIICSGLTKSDIFKNKSSQQLKRLSETLDFKKLEDINVGDIVAIPYGYNIFPAEYIKTDLNIMPNRQSEGLYKMPDVLNEEFAEFLGMYFADGIYEYNENDRNFKVSLYNSSYEVINRFKYLVKKLFGVDCNSYNDRYSVVTYFTGILFKELIKYLATGAGNKFIHNDIMKSPKSVICAFIRGMTLNSVFDSKKQQLFIDCVDKFSCKFIREVLLNIGIISRLRKGKYPIIHKHIRNNINSCDSCEIYRVVVKGDMYKLFLSEIGVIEQNKYLITDNHSKTQYLHDDKYYYVYVESIEKSVNDVYDLNIPNTHSFIANGMINHNTGRVSSDSPNLQNIPSTPRTLTTGEKIDAGHDIRQFFSAPKDCVLLSCDYSGQEVRVTAHISNDEKMIKAYQDGKDVYVEIASLAFNKPYEDCLETRPDGTTNEDGKQRRGAAKKIVLGKHTIAPVYSDVC